MLRSSFRLLRIRGIDVGAHWSWLVVLGLVVWSLAGAAFPATYPGLSDASYLAMGLVAGLLFFTSILLHELGHAFRALREGMRIDGITLWFLGGVARFKGMFSSAGAEFRIAVAGPIVSILIALFFGALTLLGEAVGWATSIQGVVDYLWRINAIVAGFNLVPALPLDGGRILRAWLWHRQGNFAAATRSAARAGTAFGFLLGAIGALNILAGTDGGGLWFIFLGWFLIQAARSEATVGVMQAALAGRRVGDLMTADPHTVPGDLSIEEFLEVVVGSRGHSAYPVVSDGRPIGLLPLRSAGQVPRGERSSTSVADVMIPRGQVAVLDADDDLFEVLGDVQDGAGRCPVVEDGRTVGILSVSDVENALQTQAARGEADAPPARRSGIFVWIVVGGLMAGVAGYLYRPPMIVLKPGVAVDVGDDISISGVPTDDVDGSYLLTSITISRPTGWGLVWALMSDHDVASREQVLPPDVPAGDYFRQQRAIFDESREVAAAAAARAIGMEVAIEGSGARVMQVIDGAPAEGKIRPGDTIVEVEGDRIDVVLDLQDAIRSEPAGHSFQVTVERDGDRRTVTVESAQLSGAPEGTPGIGVVIETRNFNVDLPFEVDFKSRDIGGPSAGLVYALAIADILDPADIADGRVVAATGTIGMDGSVGEIGGVDLKAQAADSAGASIFLVPAEQADEVTHAGLTTRGVTTLEQALSELRTTTS